MKIVFAALLAAALAGCANGHSTDVGTGMVFAWANSPDYTNLYIGEDHEQPVIPGGCDSAKWSSRYVLTKGKYWRYQVRKEAFGIAQVPPDSLFYFVVDKQEYRGRQEMDPALRGPLAPQELAEWERRIPGRFRAPE